MMNMKCNLYNIRKKKNLKQTDLAKMSGLSQKALSELETGKSKGVSFSTMIKLCEVLGVTTGELFEVGSEEVEDESRITVVAKPSCSFCSKKEQDVEMLIVGKPNKDKPKVFICSECVKRCNKLIDESQK